MNTLPSTGSTKNGMMNMSVSQQTRKFLAEVTWYLLNYPAIKRKADEIAKRISDLENKKTQRKD